MKQFIITQVIFNDGVIANQVVVNNLLINAVALLLPKKYSNLKIESLDNCVKITDHSEPNELIYKYAKYVELLETRVNEINILQNDYIMLNYDRLEKNNYILNETRILNKKIIKALKNNIFGFIRLDKNFANTYEIIEETLYEHNKLTNENTLKYLKTLTKHNVNVEYYLQKKDEVIREIEKWNENQYNKAKPEVE